LSLDREEWSASRSGHYVTKESDWLGDWVDLGANLDIVENREFYCLCLQRNPDSSAVTMRTVVAIPTGLSRISGNNGTNILKKILSFCNYSFSFLIISFSNVLPGIFLARNLAKLLRRYV
jgi:hypothetical protein